jgi:energy-coupling factor transporter ATP-binding protein EcfA2
MQPFTIGLKNYRCFEDTEPLSMDIGPGFTALVGPNNSGKSTLLKFFYEQRTLFSSLGNIGNVYPLVSGNTIGASTAGVDDALEVFHNRNTRPIEIELSFPPGPIGRVRRIRLRAEREAPQNWKAEVFCGDPEVRAIASKVVAGVNGFQLEDGREVIADISPLEELAKIVPNTVYIGPFRNAINEGAGNYFDIPIGNSFIEAWDQWKTGPNRFLNEAAQRISEDIAHVFGYTRIEINRAIGQNTLQVVVEGKPYRLRELGAGLAQFLVVFATVAMRKPDFILLDEPELNLHPALQADFVTSLATYSTHGIVFATHSIGLARSVGENLYSFQKKGPRAIARRFEQTPNFAEFVGELSFSSFKEMGHESILLVEGVTEVKAIQQFLRLLGKDHQVVVVPLGGRQLIRGGVQQELAELRRISNKVAVLIDSELEEAGGRIQNDRAEFLADCETLGFSTHATTFRAFENYLSQQAIQNVKGPQYRALGPYERLRDIQLGWAKHENWRIAREMTRTELMATDLGQYLERL